LEAAGVREHGFLPSAEAVEAAKVADQFVAGAQPEVVGVAKDDLGTEFFKFLGVEGFYGSLSADRHENRCFDRPVGQNESAAACGAAWIGGEDGK
jgi:hypothetical protein